MKYLLVLLALVCLAGCATKLTDQEEQAVSLAEEMCTDVRVNGYTVKLSPGPKKDGSKLPDHVIKLRAGAPGEALVFQTLWNQDLCVLGYAVPGFPTGRIGEWTSETSKAFDAWQPLNPANYATDLQSLRRAKDKHLAELQAKPQTKASPIRLELFKKVIPQQNFLTVVEVDAGIQFGPNAVFKGVDLSKLEGNVVVRPDQFSYVIRPALNGIREAAGRYALGYITDIQMVQEVVGSVYEAGTLRLQQAQDAQKKSGAAQSETRQ